MNTEHDFRRSLDFSCGTSADDWLQRYRSVWPNAERVIDYTNDLTMQAQGIDHEIVIAKSWRSITIDTKDRDTTYDDFLCEEWSDFGRRKPGWSIDINKRPDFIAYAIPRIRKWYLLPFELLRITCIQNLSQWKECNSQYPIVARNRDRITGRQWQTYNCPVSWDRLFAAMIAQMTRRFDCKEAA